MHAIYSILVQIYLLIIIVYVSKTILTYDYDCALNIKKNEKMAQLTLPCPTLPATCFTSLSKFIVTVYRNTGYGDNF